MCCGAGPPLSASPALHMQCCLHHVTSTQSIEHLLGKMKQVHASIKMSKIGSFHCCHMPGMLRLPICIMDVQKKK